MFNRLSSAQAERLFLLLEELGEAQQAIGKVLRHGYESHHPGKQGNNNRSDLERELGDVFAAVKLLAHEDKDLFMENIEGARDEKLARVGEYMHHQKHERIKND